MRDVRNPLKVGLALEALGVEPIFANSPQAKGRVEKLFETLQDRLVAELELAGIQDIESANTYLEETYITAFNKRFAHKAAGDHKWCRPGRGVDLARVCSFCYRAKVNNDNAVRFCGLIFDIAPGPGGRSYAGAQVELRQLLDGSWRVYYQDKIIATKESTEIGEPFRSKRRHKSARAAYVCEWVYLASRQSACPPSGAAKLPKMRKEPGKPFRATRIA